MRPKEGGLHMGFFFIGYGASKFGIKECVDPAFRLNAFPTWWRARFLFEKWFLLIKKNNLESPLIFVLFLKGKQNKKEKP